MTPLDVLLLSYIKGCFVYCPFLLVQFRRHGGDPVSSDKAHMSLILIY